MRSLLSNNRFMTMIALFFGIAGIVQSVIYQDFTWFQRSGSLIVGIGIVLVSRTFITGKDLLLNIGSAETPYNLNSPEHFKALNLPIPDYVENDLKSRTAIGLIGPLLSFIGTVIWGYGDLFNIFFP